MTPLLPSDHDVPRRALGVRIRNTREGLVLGTQGDALLLSDSAELVYRRLDGTADVAAIAQLLVETYGIDHEEAADDVKELLASLHEQHIVEW